MSTGLSQRAYAKHRGCDVSLINRWAKAGRLAVGPDGKIDAEASDKALAASIDRTRGGSGGGGIDTTVMRQEAQAGASIEPSSSTMTDARVACAVYDAKMKKLQYDREAGNVFESARVLSAITDAFESLRRTVQQIADRIASPLAAETDPRKVHVLLTAEHDAALTAAAAVIESLPQQLTATRQ